MDTFGVWPVAHPENKVVLSHCWLPDIELLHYFFVLLIAVHSIPHMDETVLLFLAFIDRVC